MYKSKSPYKDFKPNPIQHKTIQQRIRKPNKYKRLQKVINPNRCYMLINNSMEWEGYTEQSRMDKIVELRDVLRQLIVNRAIYLFIASILYNSVLSKWI